MTFKKPSMDEAANVKKPITGKPILPPKPNKKKSLGARLLQQ